MRSNSPIDSLQESTSPLVAPDFPAHDSNTLSTPRSSRRQFLSGSLATIAGLCTAAARGEEQEAREGDQIRLNAKQRITLLDEISSVIDSGNTQDARLQQMESVTLIVDQYRVALSAATDVTLDELSRAIYINRMKINMPHFSHGLDPSAAAVFINTNSTGLYGDLHQQLLKLRERGSASPADIQTQIGLIRSDICWSAAHHNPEIARRCGEEIAEHFLKGCCNCFIEYGKVAQFDRDQCHFHWEVFTRTIKDAAALSKATIEKALDGTLSQPQESIHALCDFIAQARETIRLAHAKGIINDAKKVVWSERLARYHEQKLLDRLVEVYAAVMRDPERPVFKVVSTGVRLPWNAQVAVDEGPLLEKLKRFVGTIEGPRDQVGERFINSYLRCTDRYELPPVMKLKFATFLCFLASSPAQNAPFVSDTREALRSVMGQQIDADLLATAAGTVLFSENLRAACNPDRALELNHLATMTAQLISSEQDAGDLRLRLTPVQSFVLELGKICGGAPETGADYRLGDGDIPTPFMAQRSIGVVLSLIRDLYQLGVPDVFSDKPGETLEALPLPEAWGKLPLSLRDLPDRKQLLTTLRRLTGIADALTGQLARFAISGASEKKLVERLVEITGLLLERKSAAGVGGGIEAPPITELRRNLAPIGEEAMAGPFVEAFHKTRALLYLASHGHPAPVGAGKNAPPRDKSLDLLALQVATCAEESFIFAFCARLWASDDNKDSRPLEWHRSLSSDRMASEIKGYLHSYGLFERYPAIRKLFEQPADKALDFIREHHGQLVAKRHTYLGQIAAIVNRPR